MADAGQTERSSNPARAGFTVRVADWRRDRAKLAYVREAVFVREQKVPLKMEWDDDDPSALHVLALDEAGNAVGTGRLTSDAHVGRMAVMRPWRRQGVASALLEALTAAARERGHAEIVLHAQVDAVGFYRRHGYTEQGETFMEAGIPHVRMHRRL